MMIDCMNHLAGLGILDLEGLLQVGIDNPLRVIGIDPEKVDSEPILDFAIGQGFFLP